MKSKYLNLVISLLGSSLGVSIALAEEETDVSELNAKFQRLYATKQFNQAAPIAEKILQITEETRGPEDRKTAVAANNLAEVYRYMGQYAKAEPLYERALKVFEKDSALSKRTDRKAWPRALYDRMGQYAKAEPLELRALRIYENALGPDHPDTARANINLAQLYCDKGEFAKAEPLAIRAFKVDEKKLGAEHLDTAKDLIVLANLYRDTAQYTKAEPLYQRALKIREKSLGPNHTTVATTLDELAALYWEKGQSAKAEPLSQRAAGIRARIKEERPPTATKSPATQTN